MTDALVRRRGPLPGQDTELVELDRRCLGIRRWLCQQIDDVSRLFTALWGLRLFYVVQGAVHMARELVVSWLPRAGLAGQSRGLTPRPGAGSPL